MTIEKTPEHIAADQAMADADTRLATARTNHGQANADFATAKQARGELIAASTTGQNITAEAIRKVEDDLRDAESRLAFSKAAVDGAEATRVKALADLKAQPDVDAVVVVVQSGIASAPGMMLGASMTALP